MSLDSSTLENAETPRSGPTDREEGLAREILACLEAENCGDPDGERTRLSNRGKLDPGAVEHLRSLEALWAARDAAPPSFGTMDGSSELARISLDLGDDWHSFLVDCVSNDENRFALEEFLFGISYEEILSVRSRLGRLGISAVGDDEVRRYLGSSPAYAGTHNGDPRAACHCYVDRRDAALLRLRTNAPGPKKTLEEIYVQHRIVHGHTHTGGTAP
jgi:DNA-binding transcriptional LysR family regulator